MSEWAGIETAPRDGSWFLVLGLVTIVGGEKPTRASPELKVIRRHKTFPKSDGYWQNIYGHSVADSYVNKFSRWAPLSALPLADMWDDIAADRVGRGGAPEPLPEPFGDRSSGEHQPREEKTDDRA